MAVKAVRVSRMARLFAFSPDEKSSTGNPGEFRRREEGREGVGEAGFQGGRCLSFQKPNSKSKKPNSMAPTH
jgi:hypothetical protein